MKPQMTQIFTDFLTAKAPRRTIYRGGCPPWRVNSGTRRVTVIDGFFNHETRPGDSRQGPPFAAVGGNPRPFGVRDENGRGIAIRAAARHAVGGFTLVELLTVLAILVIVAAVAIPSLFALFGGNNLVQAQNQVSSDLAYARNLALQMHTDVALVFYEETTAGWNASGVSPAPALHSGSTAVAFAMALPGQPANTAGPIYFEPYSGAAVQYLPHGIYAATLVGGTGTTSYNFDSGYYLPPTSYNLNNYPRAIVFDPDGHLIIVNELAAAENPSDPTADYGDWNFYTPAHTADYGPSAGAFVVYEPNVIPQGMTVATYLAGNADVQTVNSYTGSVVP